MEWPKWHRGFRILKSNFWNIRYTRKHGLQTCIRWADKRRLRANPEKLGRQFSWVRWRWDKFQSHLVAILCRCSNFLFLVFTYGLYFLTNSWISSSFFQKATPALSHVDWISFPIFSAPWIYASSHGRVVIEPFQANVPFIYPLKLQETF